MSKKQVLIIDDFLAFRVSLEFQLEQFGCEITSTSNGHEALTLLHRIAFDLVLLEYHLPTFSSEELISTTKDSFPHLPILVYSDDSQVSSKENALNAGASEYLLKPIEFEYLKPYLQDSSFFLK